MVRLVRERRSLMAKHLLADLIRQTGSVVIDGAMSTALEKAGCDLNDKLWSARVLIEEPAKIRQVHYDYFEAGANVAITASYQATEAGFRERGIDSEAAYDLIAQSVTLAKQARTDSLARHPDKDPKSLLVAGAVGPYGAYLANGAEYTGDYRLSDSEYRAFHRLRMKALVEAGADFLAVETQAKLDEVKVILEMMEEFDIVKNVNQERYDLFIHCAVTAIREAELYSGKTYHIENQATVILCR